MVRQWIIMNIILEMLERLCFLNKPSLMITRILKGYRDRYIQRVGDGVSSLENKPLTSILFIL